MIANPTHPDQFSFFPFTSPNPRRNRSKHRCNSDSKVSNTSSGTHLQQMQQSDCSTNSTTKIKGAATSSTMSGFNSTFDIPNKHAIPDQKTLFEAFDNKSRDDTLVKDDEAWVTFDTHKDATPDSQNFDSSPMSTKVQIGQADSAYEILDLNKDDDIFDDTVTSTTEYDDDVDYGPLPVATSSMEPESIPSESNGVKSKLNTSAIKSHILMLITNMGMNRTQVQNQQRATMMLNALNIIYETVDGSDPMNKEIRNELFTISDTRGTYPQFFIVTDHGGDSEFQISFLGDFETIEGINDSSSLPKEILDANPTLLTWDRIPCLSYQK